MLHYQPGPLPCAGDAPPSQQRGQAYIYPFFVETVVAGKTLGRQKRPAAAGGWNEPSANVEHEDIGV